MSELTASVVRRAYDAIAEGDFAKFVDTLDEEIVWHESTVGLEGDYRGQDEVAGLFGRMMQQLDGPVSVEVIDVLTSEQRALVLHDATFTRNERNRTMRYADLYEVRDGKIREHWHFPLDRRADDEFWS